MNVQQIEAILSLIRQLNGIQRVSGVDLATILKPAIRETSILEKVVDHAEQFKQTVQAAIDSLLADIVGATSNACIVLERTSGTLESPKKTLVVMDVSAFHPRTITTTDFSDYSCTFVVDLVNHVVLMTINGGREIALPLDSSNYAITQNGQDNVRAFPKSNTAVLYASQQSIKLSIASDSVQIYCGLGHPLAIQID